MLPFEFVIPGTPLSQQAKSRKLRRWKAHVTTCAASRWPKGSPPLACNLVMKATYYYEGDPLDIDNMVKPIQDALNGLVYNDDKQITDLIARKRNINGSFRVRGLSATLAEGFGSDHEFVHIRIEEPPNPEELP